jgi:hypothetical protein
VNEVERQWNRTMVTIYETAKRELGYNATRFIQTVSEQGGLAAAKQLLWSDTRSDGSTFLWDHHRLELTVEAHVLQDEFTSLFTDDDRQRALARLNSTAAKLAIRYGLVDEPVPPTTDPTSLDSSIILLSDYASGRGEGPKIRSMASAPWTMTSRICCR